jgi:hypothetical protein
MDPRFQIAALTLAVRTARSTTMTPRAAAHQGMRATVWQSMSLADNLYTRAGDQRPEWFKDTDK